MDDLLKDWNEQQQNTTGNDGWKEIPGFPEFKHPEMAMLYGWGFDIPVEAVKRILALPRETLIADLELMLQDADTRYAAYAALETEATPLPLSLTSFPVHAAFLLAELGATASLGKLLRFLGKDPVMVDFWMGDHLTEDLWTAIFKLGKDNLERIQKFVRNHDADVLARAAAVSAVAQVAWHYSGRRKEVFAWFESMFNYFRDNFTHDDEAELLGEAVSEVANLRAKDLLEAIQELYDEDLVDTSFPGSFVQVQGDMYEPINNWAKMPVKSIVETYQHFTDTWDIYSDPGEEDDEQLVVGGGYLSSQNKKKALTSFNPSTQPAKKEPQAGRNDLCPCGSGKKFKKCHGA
jgi:Protein of unknown function (DUF1186)/SEC-C motif